ncbi:MAG TPA: hypothetical protein VG917_04830 [Patescibacteria group bacterium]|nr:hypothetical protein [Patescibacteria group bacterium]
MKKPKTARLVDYSKIKFRVKKSMRYDDVGDYFDSTIISYDMKNPIFNNGIMLHEFIEYTLIRSAGIPVSMIDAFDNNDTAQDRYPEQYKLYCKYHRMANNIERHFIENMGIDWKEYQKAVYSVEVKLRPTKKKISKKQNKSWKVR